MATSMATSIVTVITTVTAMVVVISVTTAITVGKDAAIAVDVGMALVVVVLVAENMILMTVIVDCQEYPGLRVTKIPVDNNRSSYFSYNSQINMFSFGIYIN